MKSMVVCSLLLVAGAVAFVAAQGQVRPGDMSQARIWVENRAPNEAVAVSVERISTTPNVHLSSVDASVVLPTRAILQRWDYRSLPAADPAALQAAGNDGWEAVGVMQSSGGSTVLLKRPR
jgi:hypothetical protein